ncbi:MAG: hypothetical protein A2340_07575 [Lentisphaerae bacterium RIFOXYB12_FULL_60_10]|nr:MAG: hypothetical protein A2340_07575 [Lentisphaerae bacterium RIFOXYB12_FULL_60_10]
MQDIRVQRTADLLVRYSIAARPRQVVSVGGGMQAEPLITAVYESLLKAGACPVVQMMPDGLMERFFRLGHAHHFDRLTAYDRAAARTIDARIRILSQSNTRELAGIDPTRQTRHARAARPLMNALLKKPWVLTLFPTAAYAQDAGMSVRAFEDFVYATLWADEPDPVRAWQKLSREQDKLVSRLRGANRIHIVGPGTDLHLSVKGRRFINSDGHHNLPSGEVFTGPVEDSVEGVITYDFPVCTGGREIDGIRLVFRGGRVVESSATKGEDYLRAMLRTDPGAVRLGELGIGTNRRIQQFTRNILFDEKMGGTIHLALGNSYPETGGRNRSAVHWDMIKDLRKGGALYVDGKVFQKDGRFR